MSEDVVIPKTIIEALAYPHWRQAVQEEFDALEWWKENGCK